MDEFLKSLLEAGKGRVDFLAFLAIAGLGGYLLLNGLDFLKFVGFVAIMIVAWLSMRYGLLRAQSNERLRIMREGAKFEAERQLAKHATRTEIEGLVAIGPDGERND